MSLAPMPVKPSVEFAVHAPVWAGEPAAQAVIDSAIAAAAAHVGLQQAAEICVVLTDDSGITELNRRWRGQDKPTNVLSFPASDASARLRHLGDLVIAHEISAREAREEHKRFEHHLAHLAVHAFLHLMGYDHQSDKEAETMEALERVILARIGVPDPYGSAV